MPLLLLLTLHRPAPAQEPSAARGRAALVREAITNLDSPDIHVAAQAARDLGYLRAKEAVPALLRVLRSPLRLSLVECVGPTPTYNVREYVETNVREEAVTALGRIGDRRAVPVLKQYLRRRPARTEVFGGNAAYALHLLTGRSYWYRDRDGRLKLFEGEKNP